METFKVKIYSEGGQGVKSMVDRLEESLGEISNLFVTSLVKYDSIIKGGTVETNIVISKTKGLSPFFSDANLCIILKKEFEEICKNNKASKYENFTKKDTEDLKNEILDKAKNYLLNLSE